MKGIELPINILVVVAIAVIVLLGMVAMYFVGWSPFPATLSVESAKNTLCSQMIKDCTNRDPGAMMIASFDANKNGATGDVQTFVWANVIAAQDPSVSSLCGTGATTGDNLGSLCYCHYFKKTELECKKLCGCP